MIIEPDMLWRAQTLAIWAHQYQMYGLHKMPYIKHVENVVLRGLKQMGDDESTQIVGWLHDVVEDTSITLDVIRTEFSTEVTVAVDHLTRRLEERGSEGAYTRYIQRVGENDLARFVKINDLSENASHCVGSGYESLLRRYERALTELGHPLIK